MKYVHFSGNNGYCGTDYDEYVAFEDDCSENEIYDYSDELAYSCAESYEYLVTGSYDDFESEDDREAYYDNAMTYCGWNYCSKEEYEANKNS